MLVVFLHPHGFHLFRNKAPAFADILLGGDATIFDCQKLHRICFGFRRPDTPRHRASQVHIGSVNPQQDFERWLNERKTGGQDVVTPAIE